MATRIKSSQIADGAIVASDLHSAIAISTTQSGTFGSVIVDDITLDGTSISTPSSMMLNVGGNLTIDVDGTYITLADDGDNWGQFYNSQQNFYINNPTANKDIIFRGVKAGSPNVTITALTLDMSNDGRATFSENIVAGGVISTSDTTGSTNTTSGALTVAGGIGVAENAYVGGNVGVTGVLSVTDTTTSTSSSTGSLLVSGGAGIAENLNVGGNVIVTGDLTVEGTQVTLNTSALDVEDKNITLNYHASNDTSASADGAGITIQDAVDASNDASILWDATNDKFDFSHTVNITGNLVSDGLTVDGHSTFNTASTLFANLNYGGANRGRFTTDGIDIKIEATSNLQFIANNVLSTKINGTGDISFYEDNSGSPQVGMHWDYADGRLGIGTQSPSTNLHVRRSNADSGQRTIYADGTQLSAISTSGTNYLHNVWIENHNFDIDSGVTDSGYRIGLNIEGYHDSNVFEGTLATQKNIWSRNGNNTNGTGTITNSYNLHLDTLSGGGMTITNNYGLYQSGAGTKNYFEGNLGIGSTDPKRPLQIGATGSFPISFNGNYPDIHMNTYYDSGWRIHTAGFGAKTTFNGATGAFGFSNVASTQSAGATFTPQERFTILANGNVGIGTDAPGAALDVTRTSGWAEMHLDGAAGGDLILKDDGVSIGEVYAGVGHGMVLKSYSGQDMHFLTDANATPKMTITTDGQVNIGETPPSPDGSNYPRHMLHIAGTTVNPSYEQISMASGTSSSGENKTTIRMANVGNDFYLTNNYYNWGTHRFDETNEGQAFFKMLEDGRFSFGGRSSASTNTPSYNAAINGNDGSISAGSSMTMVNGMSKMNVVGNSDVSNEDVELRIVDYDDSSGSAVPTISFYKGTNTGPARFADIRLNDILGFAFRDGAGEDLLTIGLDGLTRVNGRLSGGELGNPDIVRKDLHFYVDFNDKACVSGTSATEAPLDLSPARYNLTLHGGANFEYKDGIGTYYFDGDNDHININDFVVADSSNTYEVWHYSNSQSGWETFWDSGTERPLMGLIGNQLRAYPSGTNFATIDTGKWYHIVFAFASNNDLDVYVNGHRVIEAHNWNHIQRTGTFQFWLGGDTTHEGTNGYIGVARAYTRQLTLQEVKQNYNAEVSRFATATPSLGIVQSDGNVGIGIDSPSEILEVYNNSTVGNTVLHVHNDKTGDAAVLKLEGKRTSTNDTAQIIFANNGNVGSTIRAYSGADEGDIRFYVSQAGTGNSVSQAMRIADTGNLEVVYNADIGGNVDIDGTLHVGGSGQVIGNKWHGSHENIYWNSKLHSPNGHGNAPSEWFTHGAVTITSEHPYNKGFSTSYTNVQSASHTTNINNATPSTPHWKGVYTTWGGATNYGGVQNSSIGGGWENGEGSIMKMVYDGTGGSSSTNAVRGKIWKNFFSAGQVYLRQSFFYYIESGQFSSGYFAGYNGYTGVVGGDYEDPGQRHLHTASQTWTYINHAGASYLGATYNNASQNYMNGFGFTPGVASVVWIAIPGLTTQMRNDGKTINIHRATQQIGQS